MSKTSTIKYISRAEAEDNVQKIINTDGFIPSSVAIIDESLCIGCVKCINACPFDSIIGASKQMHTVIFDACTGCGMCVLPCPVDCITLEDLPVMQDTPQDYRARYEKREARLERQKSTDHGDYESISFQYLEKDEAQARKRAAILAAVKRVKTKRSLFNES